MSLEGRTAGRPAPEILGDPDFKRLISTRTSVAWTLAALELALFFGFVALVSFSGPFLARKVAAGSAIPVGIPIAVAVIVLSWVLTGVYVHWANTAHDGLAKKLRDRIG